MDDEERWAYYNDPAHREPVGPAQRRSRPGLTSHVPVRFPPELIAAVKQLALRDGTTVSSWIRSLVEHEVVRQLPPDGNEPVPDPQKVDIRSLHRISSLRERPSESTDLEAWYERIWGSDD